MAKVESPERLELSQQAKAGEGRDTFVKDLVGKVQKAETARGSWEMNMVRWFKKRYGIRPASKTFPWPGASNVHVSLVDEKIRKLKPNYINLAFEGEPVVVMYPVGGTTPQMAQDCELFMDWLLRFYMNRAPGKNYFESLTLLVDWMLEVGFSVAKVIWDYQCRNFTKIIDVDDLDTDTQALLHNPDTTDDQIVQLIASESGLDPTDTEDLEIMLKAVKAFRDGEILIPIQLKDEVYNGPRVVAVHPKNIIVPADTTDIETARFIAHRMWMSEKDLRDAERVKKYKNVDDCFSGLSPSQQRAGGTVGQPDNSLLDITKSNREGVGQFPQDMKELLEVWEVFTYYDINGDGYDEKVVITLHPQTQTILRFIEFPYDHGRWPFVLFSYELNDDRWYSARGLPELLDHYQTIVTNQENAKLDRMTLVNSLQFKYRVNSINPSTVRFIPGEGIPVQRMEDLQELNISNMDISFDNEMSKVRQLAEALIGQPDLSLQSLAQPGERRTAFEVSEVVSLGKQIFSLDARMFKNALQKLYDQVLDLWFQYGPEEVWVTVTQGAPVRMTRKQIQGDFVIVPNGEFTLLSRTLMEQRAFALLQLAASDQSGAINQYKAWENYLLRVDPKAAKKILNDEQTYNQIQQQRMMAAEMEYAKKKELAGRNQGDQKGQVQLGQPSRQATGF